MDTSFSKQVQGFTLVELITVVTILAVLSAIGFVSFSGYLAGVRDTSRLSQLTSIYDGLELYATKYDLPLPDDAVEIRDGTSLLGYQGNVGSNILDMLDFSRGGVDPKDDSYFVYYLSANKNDFQLMGFLEEEENVPTVFFPQTYAKDYSNLYPVVFGEKLGILLDETTKTPVHEIEAVKTAGELDLDGDTETYTVYFKNDDTTTGTWGDLGDIIEDERNATTTSSSTSGTTRYPWCDMDDIILWSYTIAACNVGSSTAGIESVSYGDYFQFWKSDTTITNATYNNGDWKSPGGTDGGSANDWGVYDSTKNSATFANSSSADQGKMQGPCESGYHVPTYAEWNDMYSSGSWWSTPSDMQNTLKLPYPWLKSSLGSLSYVWSSWYYWLSSPSSTSSYAFFAHNITFEDSTYRNTGRSVRCFRDT